MTGKGALLSVKEGETPYRSVLPSSSYAAKSSEKVLTVSQFADEAKISPQAVRKMIAEGRLLANKVGKQHTVPIAELYRYLQT